MGICIWNAIFQNERRKLVKIFCTLGITSTIPSLLMHCSMNRQVSDHVDCVGYTCLYLWWRRLSNDCLNIVILYKWKCVFMFPRYIFSAIREGWSYYVRVSHQKRYLHGSLTKSRERFPCHRLQSKQLVSDPGGMHHGTWVTHVSWCMSGSLTRWPILPTVISPQRRYTVHLSYLSCHLVLYKANVYR